MTESRKITDLDKMTDIDYSFCLKKNKACANLMSATKYWIDKTEKINNEKYKMITKKGPPYRISFFLQECTTWK